MNFIGDCIKFAVFLFFLMAFIGHLIGSSPTKSESFDEKKEVFMEDCMSVSFNTKRDCEIIYKQLTTE